VAAEEEQGAFMNRLRALTMLLALYAGTLHAAAPREADETGYVSPRVLKGGAAGYTEPKFDGAENGYCRLRLSISAAGLVTDVEVMEGSYGNPVYINRAMNHVKTWKFEPATEHGEPVAARVVQAFNFNGEPVKRPIGGAMLDGISKVEEYYRAGDAERARNFARELVERRVQTSPELAALQAATGIAEAGAGNAHRAIRELRDATVGYPYSAAAQGIKAEPAMYLLPDANYLGRLLTIQMSLTAAQGMLAEARHAYLQLADLLPLPPDDPRRELAGKIEVMLAGTAPLTARIKLDDAQPWTHRLTRRQFRFQNLQGPLQQVDLECHRRWRTLGLDATAVLAIPDGWKDCSLRIRGDAGASLVVVEFAD
jgi:TonB family protein